jgi:CRISPR system Cascade subunit CasE
MFLSKLVINESNPLGLRSLLNPYEAHRTIWRAFPERDDGGPKRVLFRIEQRKSPPHLVVLVQSHLEPDWQPLLGDGVLLSAKCIPADNKIRGWLESGRLLRFRLRTNPTKRLPLGKRGAKEDGKRIGVYGEDAQRKWLKAKGEAAGFRVLDCRVQDRGFVVSRKPGCEKSLRHLCVDFDGTLEVTEPDCFLAALESGIGSAKGFGFGLLSVARV